MNLSEGSSKLKILGTVISVAGAVTMPIYKGQCLVRGKSVGHVYHRGAANKNSISGFFLLFGSFSSWSSYMIFQVGYEFVDFQLFYKISSIYVNDINNT